MSGPDTCPGEADASFSAIMKTCKIRIRDKRRLDFFIMIAFFNISGDDKEPFQRSVPSGRIVAG